MDDIEKRETREGLIQILVALFALVCYGGLFLWMDIQDNAGIAAIFQDNDKMIAKVLMALARFVR